ncbi:hypothetical protein K438DRAFT_1987710 [Mycena galopus ATCC 62051]|nr:hypothetical protein K438DRAFT_1987710 [Mycena galopus ATCC 62051]
MAPLLPLPQMVTPPSSRTLPLCLPTTIPHQIPTLPPLPTPQTLPIQWVQCYLANNRERETRKAAEEQHQKQDLLFERQVQVCCWTKNGAEPEWGRKQGLLTYPKVNIADHPSSLRKLDLLVTDKVYIYDFDGGCFHRKDVKFS